MALSAMDATRADLVFSFFQVLIEEVMEFDDGLPADRKRELRVGITECLPLLLKGLAATLPVAMAQVMEKGGRDQGNRME